VAVAGPQNLLATALVASLSEVQRLEVRLARALPQLRIADRSVALRITKHMGRLLDEEGRARAFVPVDVWTAPASAGTEPL
jgi:hypothetical protein